MPQDVTIFIGNFNFEHLSRLHRILEHPSRGYLGSGLSLVMQMVTFLLIQRVTISCPTTFAPGFAALIELKRTKEDERFDEVEALEGNGKRSNSTGYSKCG
jgi:hypothetical protein